MPIQTKMDVNNNDWQLNIERPGSLTLQTKDQFLDKNINITTPLGEIDINTPVVKKNQVVTSDNDVNIQFNILSENDSTNISIDNIEIGAKSSSVLYPYYFSIGAHGSTLTVGNGAVDVTKTGLLSEYKNEIEACTKTVDITASQKNTYVNLPQATIQLRLSDGDTNLEVEPGNISISNATAQIPSTAVAKTVSITPTTTIPKDGGIYAVIKANVSANSVGTNATITDRTVIASATREGYIDSNFSTSSNTILYPTATAKAKASDLYYLPLPPGGLSSGIVNNSTSTTETWVTEDIEVPANGYLYINEGWHSNTQISLASLIPDDKNYTNAGNANIVSGYEAYDTDGNKLIGTIPKWKPSDTYYTSTNTGFGGITELSYVNSSTAKYIRAGKATTPTNTTALTATSNSLAVLENEDLLTVTAKVTPTIEAGWVNAGTEGTVKITGTVPTKTYTVTPSASQQTINADTDNKLVKKIIVNAISPQRALGTNSIAVNKDNVGVCAYFPYGWWPQHNTTEKAYIYLPEDQIGSATAAQVLLDKTFTSSAGAKVSGTMANNGAFNKEVAVGGEIKIPVGYHNGNGIITGPVLTGTAVAADVRQNKTFYNTTGTKVTGTLPDSTPEVNATKPAGITQSGEISRGNYIKIPKGYITEDKYYYAQDDAHVSYTPNSSYFQPTNSGYGLIKANEYSTSNYYIRPGTAGAVTGGALSHGAITTTDTTYLTDTNTGFKIEFSNTASRAAASYSITTAGWIPTTGAGAGLAATGNDTKTLTKYIRAGAVGSTGGAVTGNNVTLVDAPSDISGISVGGSGKGIVTTAGWIAANTQASASSTQTKYIKRIKLTSGKRIEVENDVVSQVATLKYNSTTNSLDFIFS